MTRPGTESGPGTGPGEPLAETEHRITRGPSPRPVGFAARASTATAASPSRGGGGAGQGDVAVTVFEDECQEDDCHREHRQHQEECPPLFFRFIVMLCTSS